MHSQTLLPLVSFIALSSALPHFHDPTSQQQQHPISSDPNNLYKYHAGSLQLQRTGLKQCLNQHGRVSDILTCLEQRPRYQKEQHLYEATNDIGSSSSQSYTHSTRKNSLLSWAHKLGLLGTKGASVAEGQNWQEQSEGSETGEDIFLGFTNAHTGRESEDLKFDPGFEKEARLALERVNVRDGVRRPPPEGYVEESEDDENNDVASGENEGEEREDDIFLKPIGNGKCVNVQGAIVTCHPDNPPTKKIYTGYDNFCWLGDELVPCQEVKG